MRIFSKKQLIAIVIASVVVLATVLSYWLLTSASDKHGSISIDGNDEFDKEHGVRHGSGTLQDPFVMQNITISKGKGLSISNTDAYAVIRNMTIENLADAGSIVDLRNSKNLFFEDLTIMNASTGLYIDHCENSSFVRCHIDGIRQGHSISVWNSVNCTVSDSRVSNSNASVAGAVVLSASVRCTLINNEIVGCEQGISITYSESCVVTGSTIRDGHNAILIDSSLNMTVSMNDLGTNTLNVQGSELRHFSTLTITEDNTVNGLPVLYVNGASGANVQNVSIGQLIVVNCSDFFVRNLSFDEGTHECIYLVYCNRGIVENVRISGGALDWNMPISYMPFYGGVSMRQCENISVTSCTISNVTSGIWLNGRNLRASWNLLTNSEHAISCGGSNLTISNNTMSHGRYGISASNGFLATTDGISILNNNISDCQVGIKLSGVSNTTIRLNKIQDNNFGILLEYYSIHGGDILVCQNDFIQNLRQVSVQFGGNVSASWDSGYPAGGNYWSDYSGVDNAQGENQTTPGSDGIGDSPYHVFAGALTYLDLDFWDEYPLMSPCTA